MKRPAFDLGAHDRRMFLRTPGRFAFKARTRAAAVAWQRAFRPALFRALGLDIMAADLRRHRPRARMLDRVRVDGYIRESWVLMTEPDVPLPFWLLRPSGPVVRRPLVITPHGHNHPRMYVGLPANAKEEKAIYGGDRDIAVQAVRRGYVALAPTTRGFGYTRSRSDLRQDALHSCRELLMHSLLVGRTPIGTRVWDMMRLLDFASALPDVDPTRVAMTGNSGGGTMTLFAAACDPRIAVAVPSCYFCTFRDSIGAMEHCACNYVPGMLALGEMGDVAGLIAPRPFLAVAGRTDPIFPLAGVRRSSAVVRNIYARFGVAERCALFIGSGGHRYYAAGAWPFMDRWLNAAS